MCLIQIVDIYVIFSLGSQTDSELFIWKKISLTL